MFYLEKKYADLMVAHAQAEAPNECCGILAGSDGKVIKLYQAVNAEHSPLRYSVGPEELLSIYREIEEKGWKLLGIYHSHTHSEAYPSERDVKYAFWSEALYFIISLISPSLPVIKIFRIVKSKITEQEYEIGEDGSRI
jgi:[CysO sulfur-carrier protein]-S-L-cysteine hydrolase